MIDSNLEIVRMSKRIRFLSVIVMASFLASLGSLVLVVGGTYTATTETSRDATGVGYEIYSTPREIDSQPERRDGIFKVPNAVEVGRIFPVEISEDDTKDDAESSQTEPSSLRSN